MAVLYGPLDTKCARVTERVGTLSDYRSSAKSQRNTIEVQLHSQSYSVMPDSVNKVQFTRAMCMSIA